MTISKPREDASTWMSGEYSNGDLRFKQAVVTEKMSTLTEITIEFLARKTDVDLNEFVGKIMSVHVQQEDMGDDGRLFTGTCVSVEALGMRDGDDHFVAQVRPWFWMLTLEKNTRVFQNKTVKDIIEEVLGEHEFSDYQIKTSETYEQREYCVQYRETDFDFLSRLMEEEGLYYFFDHTDAMMKNEKLIICDGITAHSNIEGESTVTFKPKDAGDKKTGQTIGEWAESFSVTRGKVSYTDYDFEKPSVRQMETTEIKKGDHKYKSYEHYGHPGHYRGEKSLGEKRTRVSMEADAIKYFVHRGAGDVRHFGVGFLFEMEEHPVDENNIEYLITETVHFIRDSDELKDNDTWFAIKPKAVEIPEEMNNDYQFVCAAVPKDEPYRAPQITPWPEIPGIQIGEVVGPQGKEIYTDEYGRIRVRFRWDRINEANDTASCWIRVVTQWSGQNYGLIGIPRIGQEVVIQFEDGDPDRPICTGMMYNKDKMPPFEVRQEETRTGITTRSSPGGGDSDYNALMMEDDVGKEYVHMQSQKYHQLVVKDSSQITIGDDAVNVDPAAHTVDDQSLLQTVKNNVTEIVQEGDKTETVEQGNLTLTVEQDMTETVNLGNYNMTVSAGNHDTEVSQGSMTVNVAAGSITMEAMQQIELKVGGSSIKIDQAGVTITGSAMTKMTAPKTDVIGSGMLTLTGGLIKIN